MLDKTNIYADKTISRKLDYVFIRKAKDLTDGQIKTIYDFIINLHNNLNSLIDKVKEINNQPNTIKDD